MIVVVLILTCNGNHIGNEFRNFVPDPQLSFLIDSKSDRPKMLLLDIRVFQGLFGDFHVADLKGTKFGVGNDRRLFLYILRSLFMDHPQMFQNGNGILDLLLCQRGIDAFPNDIQRYFGMGDEFPDNR